MVEYPDRGSEEREACRGLISSLIVEADDSEITVSMTEKRRRNLVVIAGVRSTRVDTLCLSLWDLAAAHLLRFEVLVEEVEGLFVRAGTAGDGEHALAALIMGSLGDGDACARALADLANLAATTTDDAADHISWNADVLSLDVFAILDDRRRAGVGAAVTTRWVGRSWCTRGEVGTVASAGEAARSTSTKPDRASTVDCWRSAALDTDGWAIEDSAVAALLIVDEALANLPHGLLNAFGCTLDLDDALGGLWKHLFLSDHAHARRVLNLLDLESLTANDSAHLVVRDQETDGCDLR